MQSRMLSIPLCLGMLALAGVCMTGCKNGTTVTASEEQQFKNPPKEMPKEAIEYLKTHSTAPPQGAQAPAGNPSK